VPSVLLCLGIVAALLHNTDFSRACLRWLRNALLLEFILLLAAAAVGAIYERVSSARERRVSRPSGKLVDIGGYRLHLYCGGGSGPTVVLEHGLDGSYLDWFFVQPEVARFARVCSYDRAGYGWSNASPRARLPGVQADELHALLERAGEKSPFVLVGHSMGAFDVLMYAHRYPKQVAGIVLVDGSHPEDELPFRWNDKIWIRFMQLTASLGLPRWRKWCEGGPDEIRPLKRGFCYEPKVFNTQYRQWAAFSESAKQVKGLGSLGSLPLLVISRDPQRSGGLGKKERDLRWQELQSDLTRLSSRSTEMVAQRSGHNIPFDRPDVVVTGIRRIVEQARTEPSMERRSEPKR